MPLPRRQEDLTFWDCLQLGEQHRIAAIARSFSVRVADQFSNPDYVEEYDWASFDPDSFFGGEFQALSPEDMFRRFPKCIIENEDNHLNSMAVEKMLTYLGDKPESREDREHVRRLVDRQREAWGVAKRFNARLNSRRRELVERLGGEAEAERIRGEMAREKEEARKALERERAREAERRRWQRDIQEAQRAEEERSREAAAREATEKVQRELAGDLKSGALAMRDSIVRFSKIDELRMQDVQKQCETLGAKIGRFVRLFSRRLKDHCELVAGGEADMEIFEAAVEGVISVLELIYYDAATHMERNPDVNWTSLEVLGHLIRKGVKEQWGSTLFKLLFESGLRQRNMVAWVRSDPPMFDRLKELVQNMDRCGMGRTQNFSRAFSCQMGYQR